MESLFEKDRTQGGKAGLQHLQTQQSGGGCGRRRCAELGGEALLLQSGRTHSFGPTAILRVYAA